MYRSPADRKAEAARYKQLTTQATLPFVPMVSLLRCEYNKVTRQLTLASEFCGMPPEIDVKSHITQRIVRYKAVPPGHPLFQADQWDGEQQVYCNVEPDVPSTLIIYHQD